MTLQQLRYLIEVVECGSINAAAEKMFASQSNISAAMRDLERELGIEIFTRTNRGVILTNEGIELLGYARQVLEQVDIMEERYSLGEITRTASHVQRLAISSQHYHFCVQAFMMTCAYFDTEDGEQDPDVEYDFILRECATAQIIDDVKHFRSDAGILYIDKFNEKVLTHAFEDAGVAFHPLFEATPHVFLGESHPLAAKKKLTLEDLDPYPRYSFEQGTKNSFYYSEEPFASLPHKKNIRYSDRGTLTNLLTNYDGYTLSTGVLSSEMLSGIIAIPLVTDLEMTVGYIVHAERQPSELLNIYLDNLRSYIKENPTIKDICD